MVFYRKYRPQTISDLDSTSLREKLTSILSEDPESIPHAFLFTGPKGLGKTSTARIVAKSINCHGAKKKTAEPCNECESCRSITNGTNMDVIEIDAASNRGIDEIRDLKEKVKLSPLSARKKVYIIDEVHMLTTEAFNALLKTLEEPPEHVVFVLCTTEPQKVPATILSRCSHIMFLPASSDELVRSFQRIAKGEGIKIDEKVLRVIAELSDAGFRDGSKILEELASLSKGKEIKAELVEEQYKLTSINYQIEEIKKALSKHDARSSLVVVERLALQGIDVKYFLIKLLDNLHKGLLNQIGVGSSEKKENNLFAANELRYLLEVFGKAALETKQAVIPSLPFELAIVDWGGLGVGEEKAESDVVMGVSEVTTQTITMKTMRKDLGTMAKVKALYGDDALKQKEEEAEVIKTSGVSLLHYDTKKNTTEWMDSLWKNIISEMKTHNHTVAGVLRGCHLKSYDKKSIVIEALYKFHKEKLDDVKNMTALEAVCRQLTGNPVVVSVILKAK